MAEELHLLKYVMEGILATYTDVKMSIQEQLEKVLQRDLKSFLPNQLYHDIQSTFEDAFYCATKWKLHHPDLPLYLMLCSNDVLERLFGNLRLKYQFRNYIWCSCNASLYKYDDKIS